jgi:hypothetical protein
VPEAAVKPGKDLAMGGVDGHSDEHVGPDTQEMASNTLGQEPVQEQEEDGEPQQLTEENVDMLDLGIKPSNTKGNEANTSTAVSQDVEDVDIDLGEDMDVDEDEHDQEPVGVEEELGASPESNHSQQSHVTEKSLPELVFKDPFADIGKGKERAVSISSTSSVGSSERGEEEVVAPNTQATTRKHWTALVEPTPLQPLDTFLHPPPGPPFRTKLLPKPRPTTVPPTTKDGGKTLAERADEIGLGMDAKPRVAAKAPKGKAGASKDGLEQAGLSGMLAKASGDKTKIRVKNRAKKLGESSFQKPENGPSKKSAPKKSAPRKRASRKRPPKDIAKSKWY